MEGPFITLQTIPAGSLGQAPDGISSQNPTCVWDFYTDGPEKV